MIPSWEEMGWRVFLRSKIEVWQCAAGEDDDFNFAYGDPDTGEWRVRINYYNPMVIVSSEEEARAYVYVATTPSPDQVDALMQALKFLKPKPD